MNISVLITSYNQRDYLKIAIDSVLAQTLMPTQIVVVDDCSSDHSQDLIADYTHQYPDLFHPIYHKTNMGVSQARNNGLNAITGDYISLLDGDDYYTPEKLEKESKALQQNPNASIAFSNFWIVDADGEYIDHWTHDTKLNLNGNIFLQYLGFRLPRRNSFRSELVHYQSWKRIGFYDTDMMYEDNYMRAKLTKKLDVVYVPEVLTWYRSLKGGISSRPFREHLDALEYRWLENSELFDDLTSQEYDTLWHNYRSHLHEVARLGAWKTLEYGQRFEAMRLWSRTIKYYPHRPNLLQTIKVFTPSFAYNFIKQLRKST